MEPYFIVALCTGALFFALVITYFVYAYKEHQGIREKTAEMDRLYADENIKKIEYDLAFYDKVTVQNDRVAFLSKEEKVELAQESERALFHKIQSEHKERVVGHYKP